MFLLVAIIGLGLIIFIHEFGHFIAGKLMGLKVKEFMFGLPGPRIFSFRMGETEYGATAVPFGGYVKFAGVESELQLEEDDEDKDTPPERKYDTQPRWKKAIIMFAGPLMNLIFPVVLIAAILVGQGAPSNVNVIGEISKGSPADQVGLKKGDRILSVDGKKTKTWTDIVKNLRSKPGKQVTIIVKRDDQTLTFKPTLQNKNGRGFLGISISYKKLAPHIALYRGLIATAEITKFMIVTLFVVITQKIGLLVKESAGPVMIVHQSAKVAEQSLWQYVWFLGLISINIGIVNMLPIPPLDGGRLAMLGVESTLRRPINKRVSFIINAIGMALLLTLMVYFVFSDIAKIIQGVSFPGGG
ncbi:MAG: RIP metalloprotease RseP [Actinomycetota bacterium]|nr:RIP metalloprotease RseP [Actinomycetota bacterium]